MVIVRRFALTRSQNKSIHDLRFTFTSGSAQHCQVLKRQLRIVNWFDVFSVADSVTRDVQSLTHGIQVKTNDVRGNANGRNAPLASKSSHCCLAHLQYLGKLTSSKEFFTLFHDSGWVNSKS